jgi:hypothetical protein
LLNLKIKSLDNLTEIEYNNKLNPSFRDEQFKQLELLFEVYRLRNNLKKLRKKLISIEKEVKRDISKPFTNKIEALKVISVEINAKLKKVMLRLKKSYNIFNLLDELENNQCYLVNLDKARKKRNIDTQQYEITKGFYLQKLIKINNHINQLKNIAVLYFQELKNRVIKLEDSRIKLSTEKFRKKISKDEFLKKSDKIESLKHHLEEKLAFLKVEIIDLELDHNLVVT